MHNRKQFRKLLRRIAGDRCVCCNSRESLHWHHVDKYSKATEVTRLSGLKAFLEALKCVLLCESCHIAVHSGRTEFHLDGNQQWSRAANDNARPVIIDVEVT